LGKQGNTSGKENNCFENNFDLRNERHNVVVEYQTKLDDGRMGEMTGMPC
jgi:hypothetical protein